MSRIVSTSALAVIGALSFAGAASAQHTTVSPDQLKWGAAPPALPKGAEMAVISGDPSKDAPYVVRVKAPAGYKVAPHTHPTDENITVISGTFNLGMGDKFDDQKGAALKAGGFAQAAKAMPHYAWFSDDGVIQIHGIGPFAITYVDPADDPRKGN